MAVHLNIFISSSISLKHAPSAFALCDDTRGNALLCRAIALKNDRASATVDFASAIAGKAARREAFRG
jgi:hypothetical protein